MARLARLSLAAGQIPIADFETMTVEEFETWKSERKLTERKRSLWRYGRREKTTIAEILLAEYKADDKLNKFLNAVHAVCGPNDRALFGRIIWEALSHKQKNTPVQRL